MALMNIMFWQAIVFELFLYFCFLLSKDNTIVLLKYLCVEFISIKLPWENKSVFEKVTQLVARALVAIRKRKKLIKKKPQHWRIFIIWQGQGDKNLCHNGSFMSLTITNLRTTVLFWKY